MAERQLPKLNVAGSNPVLRLIDIRTPMSTKQHGLGFRAQEGVSVARQSSGLPSNERSEAKSFTSRGRHFAKQSAANPVLRLIDQVNPKLYLETSYSIPNSLLPLPSRLFLQSYDSRACCYRLYCCHQQKQH